MLLLLALNKNHYQGVLWTVLSIIKVPIEHTVQTRGTPLLLDGLSCLHRLTLLTAYLSEDIHCYLDDLGPNPIPWKQCDLVAPLCHLESSSIALFRTHSLRPKERLRPASRQESAMDNV
jgi:hypothetical protein